FKTHKNWLFFIQKQPKSAQACAHLRRMLRKHSESLIRKGAEGVLRVFLMARGAQIFAHQGVLP
ncbi:hypothetical protein, partial [Pseudomonas cichorii]|uniref:hypothetical protein n=1 Tax=Pseudomonas cichorii TaxID=36746 RepID=UPI001C7FDEC1